MALSKKIEMQDIEKCLLGTILLYIMTYLAVSRNGQLSIDFSAHASWAAELCSGELTVREFLVNKSSYPIWHVVTAILYKYVGLNENEAAASATAFFNCFTYWCVNAVWSCYGGDGQQKSNTWLWSFLLMIMGPLYMPRYAQYYYLGQGTGNIWHNPTNMAVKGTAVLAFMLIGALIYRENNSVKHYLLLAVLLMISALEKPSFLQGIIPGVGLYMILRCIFEMFWRRDRKKFVSECKNFIKIITAFIPAAFILFFQFYVSFFSGEQSGGIGIAYGFVLHNYSSNLFHSFLLAFAFPIVVLIIDFKSMIKDIFFQVACCYEFSAWLESAMIYEKGTRMFHGNWLWASYLSMFIVWMISLMKFCENISKKEINSHRKVIGIGIGISAFSLQVLCGFLYWYSIATCKISY